MFPNVRLLIGALFASIVTLSCGFGLFAAFRVNHEPLSRLPVGNASVQLVANEVAAPRAGWGTPFDGQSRVNGLQPSETPTKKITAAMPVSQSKASSPATVGAISPAAANAGRQDTAAPAAAAPSTIAVATPSAQSAGVAQPTVAITADPPGPEAAAQTPAAATVGAPQQSETAASTFTGASVRTNNSDNPASVAPGQTASVPSSAVKAPSPTVSLNPVPDTGRSPASSKASPAPTKPEQSASVPASVPAPATSAASAASPPTPQSSVADTEAPTPAPKQTEEAPDSAIAPVDAAATPSDTIDAKNGSKAIPKPVARRRVATRKRIVRKWRARATVQNHTVFQTAPKFSGVSASRGSANSFGWGTNSWANNQSAVH